ncbi:transposase [Scytonema hofmannii PCC 7110]|uniref:Transposase n=1 Tax=Scytonema hofmannii PCC 7110 TaxID=128403 RepID=A0A139X0G8_9CYAN|nr:Rpn family recombination-promoting nuclease/putative transposase [Scytonema hofmannii]KYC38201.1 transposase [Scytonema hofmannii PCC 7110]
MTEQQASYDSPWKEALELYFEAFIDFFFPQAYTEIDWQRGYEFLDKEFQQIVKEAEIGKLFVDKLVKVWRRDGEQAWVLIHVEIQSQVDSNLAKRMYQYHYRIFDRYDQQVVSLAVLGDTQASWRPQQYSYELWGCQMSLKFPSVKLLDYDTQLTTLEQNPNPFAVLVKAHLRTQATTQDAQGRLQWKLSLIRQLYELGYTRNKILQLFRLIDWMMALPEELERVFDNEMNRYEEEKKMPYITSVERVGMLKVQREYLIDTLETRFGEVPPELMEKIENLYDMPVLKQLHRQAITIGSLEEFQQLLGQN